jgi:hypothetical protein
MPRVPFRELVDFRSHRDAVLRAAARSARDVVQTLAVTGVALAKEECPVLTGALRRDVQFQMHADPQVAEAVYGNGLSYAPFVNLGHRVKRKDGSFTQVPANPYLLRSLHRLIAFAQGVLRG